MPKISLKVYIIAIIIIILVPLGHILAINILFNLNIPYNLFTWAASAWLALTLFGPKSKLENKISNEQVRNIKNTVSLTEGNKNDKPTKH